MMMLLVVREVVAIASIFAMVRATVARVEEAPGTKELGVGCGFLDG